MGFTFPSLYHITSCTLSGKPSPILDVGVSSQGIVASRPTADCTSAKGPGTKIIHNIIGNSLEGI